MVKVVALWNIPKEMKEEEFENWYQQKHIQDAKNIPGLRKYQVNKVVQRYQSSSKYYRMAELCFDSIDAAEKALESPEWQYAFKDAKGKIADHVRLFFDTREVI